MSEPIFLHTDDVLNLHSDQLEAYGGLPGVRDVGALEAAVEMPRATFDAAPLHPSVFALAAAYAFHIAEAQTFIEGNKRTALNAALVFLLVNGWLVRDPDARLAEAMLAPTARSLDEPALARLLEDLAIPDDSAEDE